MGYRKLTVYLFTLLFTVLAVVLWHMEPQVETVPVDVIITAAGEERTVTGWKNDDGEYYLFLPGYADPAALRLRLHADDVRIDGKPAEDGMTCEGFSLGEP